MSKIVLKNLAKHFGAVKAVDNLTLEIPAGSFTTLLGPSGCGKTTTLRMIAGLETPTDGEIWIGDQCVFSRREGRFVPAGDRGLGLVFQSYALWPHLTVFENIAFGLKIAKVKKAEVQKRVEETAEVLQIGELLKRYPNELSGGQQQRVAIARVLVMRPQVLLLDEPLSNLDAKLRMDMRAELKRLHSEMGSTVVYVTHDQLEALTLSTHVAIMDRGTLQQWSPSMVVYNQPANVFTADFIGNPRINLVQGVFKKEQERFVFAAPGLELPLDVSEDLVRLVGRPVTLGLRAEDFTLSTTPAEGFLAAEVESVLPAGSEWFVRVRLGELALMTSTTYDPQVDSGGTLWIQVKPEKMKFFDEDEKLIIGIGSTYGRKEVA
ncbi:MAG TPA: ABC transporter ATP-binding protein [Limnochordia bacterium]|nr:ABC transporter ATP-binding protein [Limnochordia bacterium]